MAKTQEKLFLKIMKINGILTRNPTSLFSENDAYLFSGNIGLGKNQSQDFDAQIAASTISFIQYITPATHKRANNYETIGCIFKVTKDDIAEQIFTDRLFVLIMELIEILANMLNLAIDMDKTISSLNTNFHGYYETVLTQV